MKLSLDRVIKAEYQNDQNLKQVFFNLFRQTVLDK